jgi:hypothetical protein
VRRRLPERLGPFRSPPIQIECVPASILPSTQCKDCGRGTDNSSKFKKSLDQATNGHSEIALAHLLGLLYPDACSSG